ncbi:Protein N-terminal and lysine N-methyltransferase efm7 [Paecilomyces lecythidis]
MADTMQQTLKKTKEAVAFVIFTPYQPWLLPKTEKFFPLAEESGFKVTKIFEKLMATVLFENDPGVCFRIRDARKLIKWLTMY